MLHTVLGNTRFEVFMSKIHIMVFWVGILCSDVGYQCFRGPWCLHLQGENGGNMVLWNVGILPHCYMASQPRTQLEAT